VEAKFIPPLKAVTNPPKLQPFKVSEKNFEITSIRRDDMSLYVALLYLLFSRCRWTQASKLEATKPDKQKWIEILSCEFEHTGRVELIEKMLIYADIHKRETMNYSERISEDTQKLEQKKSSGIGNSTGNIGFTKMRTAEL